MNKFVRQSHRQEILLRVQLLLLDIDAHPFENSTQNCRRKSSRGEAEGFSLTFRFVVASLRRMFVVPRRRFDAFGKKIFHDRRIRSDRLEKFVETQRRFQTRGEFFRLADLKKLEKFFQNEKQFVEEKNSFDISSP